MPAERPLREEQTATRSAPADERLAALEDFSAYLTEQLVGDLTLRRDNPGKTPPAYSIAQAGRPVVTFGIIDRTFYWTFDNGESNHYSKNRDVMRSIIVAELTRAKHIAS